MRPYDVAVIGAGIIGLATARALLMRRDGLRLAVVEKEPRISAGQTGHNSGVIHSGLYHLPGTLRAGLSSRGAAALYRFCEEQDIPTERCGKVIVATSEEERPRLRQFYHRGLANGVKGLEIIGPERLRELEPHCRGVEALWSPHTGIVDFARVAHALARDVRNAGGEIQTGNEVKSIKTTSDGIVLGTTDREAECRYVISCAGIDAAGVAAMNGGDREPRIMPMRGEYWRLRPQASHLCRNLIYPVPDPAYPFLGVHFSRHIGSDEVWLGPDAAPALAREAFRPSTRVRPRDAWRSFRSTGLPRLASRNPRRNALEVWRDFSKRPFLRAAHLFMPELSAQDLLPAPPAVRAQAVDANGRPIEDFVLEVTGERVLHVRNAPSPAATACLAIAELIASRAEEVFWQGRRNRLH
ncbi:MAG TPA: L-2-hydroxyglutarate oxidase [Candidatus Dormibacteraeota bacterium]|jgi:L-2-hydroxyglutarate oxidase LhgO|nr:L-2-hydroxyglutarate oxidase [Candidatus Dormibacteraeota bacterium]